MAAEADESRTLPTQHISMQMNAFPRDMLQKFISSGNHFPRKYEEVSEEDNNTEEEEIELSLGLSLNGRFGVDPISANKLKRSSSIPDFMNPAAAAARDGDETLCMLPLNMMCATAPLTRTCSLPVETEEQWRKRKELQSLRRMEAKRKRTEKQRNINIRVARERERDRGNFEENCEEDKRVEEKSVLPINGNENEQYNKVLCLNGGERDFCDLGIESKGERGNGLMGGGCLEGLLPPALAPPLQPSSQGSIGSQGSGSSGISEFESQPVQGMNNCIEVRSPASMQSLADQGEQKPAITLGTAVEDPGKFSRVAMENPSQKLSVGDKGAKEMMRNVMAEMPCVSTKGEGPNGKRIEGFLYRYRKGEEVRIVCVCHGSFLSPAEFVKHAGGGDVAHPLKHIVVNPFPFL